METDTDIPVLVGLLGGFNFPPTPPPPPDVETAKDEGEGDTGIFFFSLFCGLM
jgi:hypothetical protein